MAKKKKSSDKMAPVKLKEEPSFQQVMADIRARRKEKCRKKKKS